MKNFGILFLAVFAFSTISCHKEETKKGGLYCDYFTGDVVESQLGRIYKWTDPANGKSFYYIGNQDTNLKTGGFLPCDNFPQDFDPEKELGTVVIYSGKVKLGWAAEEPLYFGIELTELKKSNG